MQRTTPRLSTLARDLGLTCYDVGARGGIVPEVADAKELFHAVGFEPDESECNRLNESKDSQFHSLKFIPEALGPETATRTLFHTRHPGSSTLLAPDPAIGERFGRPEYFDVVDRSEVSVSPLDHVCTQYELQLPHYLKVDVEGGELDVLRGATATLQQSVIAVRLEVCFFPMRENHPLAWDLMSYLQGFAFSPVELIKQVSWRSESRLPFPAADKGEFPMSKGVLAHGDVLFFKNESWFLSLPTESRSNLGLTAVILSSVLGHIDYAMRLIRLLNLEEFCRVQHGIDICEELKELSRQMHTGMITTEPTPGMFSRLKNKFGSRDST
ncbi:MAG TPA: hypothetical protein DDW52_26020 [Planctomycetaceae bacterium]|nr:hypothetical protein [Planctomycetaceae bacterium]